MKSDLFSKKKPVTNPPGPPVGRLHILTDYHFQQRYPHAELAQMAIKGGADTIQFRQKKGLLRHILIEAERTKSVCTLSCVPLIIDDDLSIALAVDASGVHLGLSDMPVTAARRLLGPSRTIGATATTVEQAVAAENCGATYIGFGPVFPTRSKINPTSVKGIRGLSAVCKAVSIPVIAIAGIVPSRLAAVFDAGAHGVAVLSSVVLSPDPTSSTAQFREEIEKYGF